MTPADLCPHRLIPIGCASGVGLTAVESGARRALPEGSGAAAQRGGFGHLPAVSAKILAVATSDHPTATTVDVDGGLLLR